MPTLDVHTSSGRFLGTVHVAPKSGTVRCRDINGERMGTISEEGFRVTASPDRGGSMVFANEARALGWLWQVHTGNLPAHAG